MKKFILGLVFLAFTACGAPEMLGPDLKEEQSQSLDADTTPPVSIADIEQPPDENGEYRGNVSIRLTATDDTSGVAAIVWVLSGAQTGSGSVTGGYGWVPIITNYGTTTLTFYARDNAGNLEPVKTFTVVITPEPRTCRDVDLNDYNVFSVGNYIGGHDVRGKVVVGGDLSMEHFSVGAELPDNDTDNVVVAGGNLNLRHGAVFGNAYYSGTTTLDGTVSFYRGVPAQDAPIDFEEQGEALTELSGQLAMLDQNTTTQLHSWGGLFLDGSDPQLNVFWVDAWQLTSTRYFSLNVPSGSVAVINVFGNAPTIANFANNYSGVDATGVLFNFPDASYINAYNYGFFGTVLAPGADFHFNEGSFDGGIYSGSLTGNAEGHLAPLRVFRICGYWGGGL
ncbi:MAG TPA: choice-of-anchor A family protein [Hyalangium sp.]|nr:choice-of-anchor A family protein [Hyalangium sp.]